MRGRAKLAAVAAGLLVAVAGSATAILRFDVFRDDLPPSRVRQLFGVLEPLEASSTASITAERAKDDPAALARVAEGLKVEVVSGLVGGGVEMVVLWPNDSDPTHLIACNEESTISPGVQRIEIESGWVETIVTGTDSCDGIRDTPWGTILFSEEAGGGPDGGRVYELMDPLNTTGVTLDRTTGAFSGGTGSENLTVRPALGRLSFEGFALYGNGVTYYGDELRPMDGAPGGAYFKFVPKSLWTPGDPPIAHLADSPFVDGSVFGLRVHLGEAANRYGRDAKHGLGNWIPVPDAPDPDLRAAAAALDLTGYYRPEDIDIDRAAEARRFVRFCANNTGNEFENHQWGETICITDGSIDEAASNAAAPEVHQFLAGSSDLPMPDNLAYQPGKGNWILHEDGASEDTGRNNDLFSCLSDGADGDLLSDGCIRVATLNDLTAEWTGGIFDAAGKRFFVSVPHNVTGFGVILEITGWN